MHSWLVNIAAVQPAMKGTLPWEQDGSELGKNVSKGTVSDKYVEGL